MPDFSARKAGMSDRGTEPATRARDSISRRRRLAVWLTVVAAVWSLGLVIAAVALPVDNTTTVSPDGTTFVTKTLVSGEGAWVLIPILVPLVITGVVALALRRRMRAAGAPRSRQLAWVAIALLIALAVLSILSVGGFVLPVAIALAAATWLSPAAAAPTSRDPGRAAPHA